MKQTTKHTIRRWTGLMLAMCILGLMLPVGALRQDYNENDRTKFTENEQITMLTLWSIFRSPLFIGGEMTKFDDFTLSLLTNRDILGMHKNARHAGWLRKCRLLKVRATSVAIMAAARRKSPNSMERLCTSSAIMVRA